MNDLILGLDLLRDKLREHEMITVEDWENCFKRFNESQLDGNLFKVTKE